MKMKLERPVLQTPYDFEIGEEKNTKPDMVESAGYRQQNIEIADMLRAGVQLSQSRASQYDYGHDTPIGQEDGKPVSPFMDFFQAQELWKQQLRELERTRLERSKLDEKEKDTKEQKEASTESEKPSKKEEKKEKTETN